MSKPRPGLRGILISSIAMLLVLLVSGWLAAPIVAAPKSANPPPAPPEPVIQEIIDQVTQDDLMNIDSGLSGEHSVIVGGQPYTMSTRYTRNGQAIAKTWQYAYEQFEAAGLAASYFDYTQSGYSLKDIIGTITGTVYPDRVYLLTAHIDDTSQSPSTYAPGADDNGSGSTLLLDAARILRNYNFDSTVRVVAFTGEEQGLWGSYAYAQYARQQNWDIRGVVNADMIAWDSNNDGHAKIYSGDRPDSNAIADVFFDTVTTYGLTLSPVRNQDPGMASSDHYPFWVNNYPAFLGIEEYGGDFNAYYHTINDRVNCGGISPCGFNQPYFTNYSKALLGTVARLAGAHPRGTPTPTVTGTPPTNTPTRTRTTTPTPTPTSCTNYVIGQSTGATIVAGTVDTGNHTDDGITFVTLPFSYDLYGVPYTGANVSSNGNLQFVTSLTDFSNDCLPSSAINGPTIFAFWDDLRTDGSGAGIYTSISGSAPDRIFNVEWRAETYSGANHVNFEMRLYEGQNKFDIVYGALNSPGDSATVGVQNAGGSLVAQFECNTGGLSQGLMLAFVEPPCVTPTPGTPPPTGTPTNPTSTVPPTWGTVPPGPTDTPVPPTPCAIQFSDVPPGSTFYAYVRCLACRGILGGYSDGTFRPGNNITRGQLAKIVSNSAGFVDPPGAQIYEDVPPTNTFFDFVQRLSHRAVVGGYACGGVGEPCVPPGNLPYFRPNNNATRGQIAKIDVNTAVNALGWTLLNPPGNTFEDVARGSTFFQYIETAVAHGVMGGYPCGTPPAGPCSPPANKPYFVPDNNATRGQTAKIVANTFFANCETPARK